VNQSITPILRRRGPVIHGRHRFGLMKGPSG
jgi:hypothetical protein